MKIYRGGLPHFSEYLALRYGFTKIIDEVPKFLLLQHCTTAIAKMRTSLAGPTILFVLSLVGFGHAQKCADAGKGKPNVVAKGFTSYVLSSTLSGPRGLIFDKEGNLLVVEKTTAGQVTAIKLKEEGGCVSIASKQLTGAVGPGGSVRQSIA
jgi:hypothetical protein